MKTRRGFLKSALAATAASSLGFATEKPARASKPNILLVCADQQHWRAHGKTDSFYTTPHLDRLAESGTTFSHAFCTTPQCSPSRSTLYTGRYPHATTVIGNVNSVDHRGEKIPGLPAGTKTVASRLKDAGYHTGYTGKWHLAQRQHFAAHFDMPELDTNAHDGATDSALTFLRQRAEQPERPFALFVNYVNPHNIYQFGKAALEAAKTAVLPTTKGPIPHPSSWADTLEGKPPVQKRFMTDDQGLCVWGKPDVYWEYYRELYREKVRLVDGQLGKLLDGLEELGLAENTLVVYTSDHGDMETHNRLIYKGPCMYDHLVRVPLVMRLPTRFGGTPATLSDGLTTLADVTPTLCALAGAEAGETHGASLLPYLSGGGSMPERDFVVSQYYNKQRWVNPIRMLRSKDFKYNRYRVHGEELYDLRNDPEELHNLANDPGHTAQKRELAALLDDWMQRHGDTAFDDYPPTNRDGTPYRVQS